MSITLAAEIAYHQRRLGSRRLLEMDDRGLGLSLLEIDGQNPSWAQAIISIA